jgi:hypothetical protein
MPFNRSARVSSRALGALLAAYLGTGCSPAPDGQPASDKQEAGDYVENPATGLPMNPSKRRLPSSIKIVSDEAEYFGIELSTLTKAQRPIVESAWTNYEVILSGGHPDCPQAPFAPSDGGTLIYFCDGYDVARVHSMSGREGAFGYDYGPSLDLLNGQRVERLRFLTEAEMAKFDQASTEAPEK